MGDYLLLRPRRTRACEDRRTPLIRIIPVRANDRSIPITRQRNRPAKRIGCCTIGLGDRLLLRPRGTRARVDRRTPLIRRPTHIIPVRANDRRIPITRQRNRTAKKIACLTTSLGDCPLLHQHSLRRPNHHKQTQQANQHHTQPAQPE